MKCIYCNSEKESLTFSIGEYKVTYCPDCFNYENDHCKHENSKPVLLEMSGKLYKRLLCSDCYTLHGSFIKQIPCEKITKIDKEKYDIYKLNQGKQLNDLLEPIRIKAKKWQTEHWFSEHGNYLNSETWKAKRLLVLERDNYLCQSCRKNKATEVHHLNYKHRCNEPLFDLVSVCHSCHELITRLDRS